MPAPSKSAVPPTSEAGLSIGELAAAAGVTPEVLRTWEARHGFPVGDRTPSGHRRFGQRDVRRVRDVLSLRSAGLTLQRAIARVLAADEDSDSRSLHAHLRSAYPELRPERLRARTLVALSHAIEDESCVLARTPVLFGAFQTGARYRRSEERWRELDRTALFTLAMAELEGPQPGAVGPGPLLVPLVADDPMRREWAVVCVSEQFHALLTAWELPGQAGARRDRVFEAIWTTDHRVVRGAARLCAGLARRAGVDLPDDVVAALAGDGTPTDPAVVESLFARTLGYVDRLTPSRQ
jgi:DNA-binding transcriptional MerR regulator